jgi:hypothetical protein
MNQRKSPSHISLSNAAIGAHDHAGTLSTNVDHNSILFKNDYLYKHKVMRINYTAYDEERGQDVLHMTGSSPSRCNVMVLDIRNVEDRPTTGVEDDASDLHGYRFARVLGIYHANVLCKTLGQSNLKLFRMEFLWVRWYQLASIPPSRGKPLRLLRLHFPPVNDTGSFDFLDPNDVLRACHILPAFAHGKKYLDGVGLSRCASDSQDYRIYYINRCAAI